jgi:hypothetical protein
VSESESRPQSYPFENMFDLADALGDESPRFVGLGREEAEELARAEGLATRMLELPVAGSVAWRADRRPDRLNLVVRDGCVIRAAVF